MSILCVSALHLCSSLARGLNLAVKLNRQGHSKVCDMAVQCSAAVGLGSAAAAAGGGGGGGGGGGRGREGEKEEQEEVGAVNF